MAVTSQQTIFTYTASGSATVFPFSCRVLADDDLVVTVDGIEAGLGVDYSVTGVGNDSGGSIVFGTAPDAASAVRIFRQTELTRDTDYQFAGDFRAEVVNADIDRVYMAMQDLQNGSTEVLNSLRAPAGEVVSVLPDAATRANRLLGFDSDGDPVALVEPDAAGATALDLALRSVASSTVGAGQLGFKGTLNYAVGTIGRELLDGGPSVNSYPGVDPTGVADSITAINAAIAAWSALGVKAIRFPGIYAGAAALAFVSNMAYAITGTINSTAPNAAILFPAAATKIQIDGRGVGKIAGTFERGISSVLASTCSDIRVEGMDISGATRVGAGYTSGIFLDGASRIWLEKNYCHGNGIGVSTATGNCDILVYAATNAYVYAAGNLCNSSLVGFNLAIYNTTDWHAHGNTLGNAVCGSSQNNGYGLMIYSSTTDACKRGTSIGNAVFNTGGSGLYYQNCVDFTSIGNQCFDVAKTQTDVGLPVGGVSLNGCTGAIVHDIVNKSGKAGIVSANGVRVTLDGVVSDCSGPGFYVRGAGDGTRVRGLAENCAINVYADATAKADLDIDVTARNSKAGTRGIDIQNASYSIIKGIARGNARDGCLVLAGTGNEISVRAINNGADAANTYDGIVNGSTNTTIHHSRSGNTGATGQRYGITNSGAGVTLDTNNCTRNQTDGINDSGSNTSKDGNRVSLSATPGAVEGNGTLVAGTLTVATDEVSTSDFIDLQRVTPGGGTAGQFTYTIVNATSFTVTSSSGTDTPAFHWRIRH